VTVTNMAHVSGQSCGQAALTTRVFIRSSTSEVLFDWQFCGSQASTGNITHTLKYLPAVYWRYLFFDLAIRRHTK
jgi:hypothetical protein